MSLLEIKIPDLFNTPYITIPVELNSDIFYFEYSWNNRHNRAYLSIYLLDDNVPNYLAKRICLVNGVEVSRYIINDRWVGGLFFVSDITLFDEYDISTVSDNFYLLYNSEYEGKHG